MPTMITPCARTPKMFLPPTRSTVAVSGTFVKVAFLLPLFHSFLSVLFSMSFFKATLCLTLFLSVIGVFAEKHTITFDNQCGHGSPRLVQSGNILSTGEAYTSSGPFWSAIAYLQTGDCLLNGEGCSIVEMSLANPTCAGCGSSADISLIPPLAFSVPVSFEYSGGCDGQGALCTSKDCTTAFFAPDDNQVQVACQTDDVNLFITFCGDGTGSSSSSAKASSSSHAVASSPFATKQVIAVTTSAKVFSTAATHASVTASASATASTAISTTSASPKCSRERRRRRRSLASDSPAFPNISRARHAHQNRRRSLGSH